MSPRQLEVVELVASGMLDKEIARRLGINVRTVRYLMERAAEQTGHRRRGALVAYWLLSAQCDDAARERVRQRLRWTWQGSAA